MSECSGIEPLSGGSITDARDTAIERVLDRTLDDLTFVFGHPDDLERMSHDRSQIIRAIDKVAVETVLLADVLTGSGTVSRQDPRIERILSLAAALIRSPRNRYLFSHNPRLCTSFGLGHILLGGMGYPDPAFDRVLTAAAASPALHPANKLPFRLLDDYWVLGRAGLGLPRDRQKALAPFTMLTAPISPLYYRTDDYYALTHEVMYLTDFGRDALPPEYDATAVLDLIEISVLDNLRAYDLDVLAELVAASAMVKPGPLRPPMAAAAAVLADEFDDIGLLPSRNFDPEEYAALTNEIDRRCYLFFNTYHTTHVFAMMRAVLHRAGAAKAGHVAQRVAVAGPKLPRSILLARNTNAPRWLPRLDSLDLPADARENLVTGVALFDAIRRQDGGDLARLVGMLADGDVVLPGPLSKDLVEYVHRLHACRS
ncbi:MAG: hypothetical protein WBA67_03585 [Jannaschia sp.]